MKRNLKIKNTIKNHILFPCQSSRGIFNLKKEPRWIIINNDNHYQLGGECMDKQYQSDMDSQKNIIIDSLLDLGIYKKGAKQLYELTLTELEKEYLTIIQQI